MQSQSMFYRRSWRVLLALVLSAGLALTFAATAYAQDDGGGEATGGDALRNPDECAKCHAEEYRSWQESDHAEALNDPVFIEAAARAGNPKYCQTCHATGYDPVAGSIDYEGVSCLACHAFSQEEGTPHMTTDTSADKCGECHTGAHAPDYDEWLVSDHATMNIGCADCHMDHSTDLRMEDPTELCASCHKEDFEGSVHGQEGMDCHDCHMAEGDEVVDNLSGKTNGAGHTFAIPAFVCSDCHGMTHTITASSEAPETEHIDVAELEAEAEQQAAQNLNLGITGGGIGGLVVGMTITFLLRRRERNNE